MHLDQLPDFSFPVDSARLPIADYVASVEAELSERWSLFATDLAKKKSDEVVGALLARQATLAISLAENLSYQTMTVGRMILRAMVENHINIAWILADPDQRSHLFVEYGLGQTKLQIALVRQAGEEAGLEAAFEEMCRDEVDWLNSERWEHLTDVNIGTWSGKDLRSMAEEVGLLDRHRRFFQHFSSSVHSTWPVVAQYNLERCANPLHAGHRLPVISREEPQPYYLWMAAAELAATFRTFDRMAKIDAAPPRSDALIGSAFPRAGDESGA